MEYNIGKAVGLSVGIIVGLIVCVFAFRFANRDKKIFTKYDERQQAARGKAYMYGFWATIIATAIVIILDVSGLTVANRFTEGFFIIFAGIIAQISYSIFHDAYYGINTNKRRFLVVCIIAGLCNLLGVIGPVKGGTFIEDGVVSDAGTNLLCVIMLFVMAIELFIKDRIDSKKAVEEESGD